MSHLLVLLFCQPANHLRWVLWWRTLWQYLARQCPSQACLRRRTQMPFSWTKPLDQIYQHKGQVKHLRWPEQASRVRQVKLLRVRLVLSCQSPREDFEFHLRIPTLSVCDPFQQLAFASTPPVWQGARLSSPHRSAQQWLLSMHYFLAEDPTGEISGWVHLSPKSRLLISIPAVVSSSFAPRVSRSLP